LMLANGGGRRRRHIGTCIARRTVCRRSRVTEMPGEQAKSRSKRVGEQRGVIVSPTGTKHRPVRSKMPRVARSRAKSPATGRQKQGRTAESHRGQSGRAEQRAGIGRRAS
jgi:hypothetical protein